MSERPEPTPGMPGREAEDMPTTPRPEGPVPGSGSSSSQAAGEDPNPAPPAGGASPGGQADADQPQQEVENDLAQLLAEAETKRDEYLELARRAQADFENYRKRMAAEVQAAALRGKVEVARGVVPVVDDLERALQAAGLDPEGDSEDALAHGVLLVFRNLRETLGRSGVEVVDPKGEKFDPNFHEALSTVQVEGAEAGVVVEVMQKGYRFEGQLIRPAMVVVAA
jgi:molecular chaperone GrpE